MQRNLWEQFKNAFRKGNNGLIQLILINAVVFVVIHLLKVVLELSGLLPAEPGYYSRMVYEYLGLPAALSKLLVRPWTIVTTFFTHYGFFHLLWNMLFLYWFGRLIKEYLGNAKLINLYILGGLCGGALYILIYNLLPYFSDIVAVSSLIGASAGVLAIVIGAATLMPNHQFHLLFLGPIRIKWIALIHVLFSLFGVTGSNAGGDIAHLGGCLIGYYYIVQLQKGRDLGTWVQSSLDFLKSFFVRPKVKVTHRSTRSTSSSRKASSRTSTASGKVPQEEIDAILDKINEKGYESLSKEEKQKLFNASNK